MAAAETKLSTIATAQDDDRSAMLGIVFILTGIFIFSLQDVAMKLLSDRYSVFQIVFFRGMVGGIILIVLVYVRHGFDGFNLKRPVMVYLRGALQFCSYLSYFLALATLPISTVASLTFSAPIMVTALSVPFLGETVGGRRWAAVLVGFLGIMFITQPIGGGFDSAMILAVMAAAFYATSIIITRKIAADVGGATQAFHSNMAFVVLAAVGGLILGDGAFLRDGAGSTEAFLLRAWSPPEFWDLMLIWGCGVISGAGFFFLAEAYRLGSPALVAPFEYVAMPVAALWGFLFFDTLPTLSAAFGILLIIVSGLYIVRRERIRKAKAVTGGSIRPKI